MASHSPSDHALSCTVDGLYHAGITLWQRARDVIGGWVRVCLFAV